jgi:pimeloyl-ACP methyl ester carboxylesterase
MRGNRDRLSIRSVTSMARRIALMTLALLCAGILLLIGSLQLWSPGKPKPFLDRNGDLLSGSLSEKIWVNVNGVEQGMVIQSKNTANPILLYLHGGMPDYFLTQNYPIGLEEYFTVIWWDRRGIGLSYSADAPPESMTIEQFISDTLAVTNYLRQRFGQEKIYLMGHSGGTFIGIQAAARAPELYYAYIGVAQMANQLASEKEAYDYMREQFKVNGNTRMVQKLEAAPVTMVDGTPAAYLAIRDEAMHSLGIGTMHDMRSVISGVFLPSLTFRQYTLGEKINLWRGKMATGVSTSWDEILATDLGTKVPELEIPVYFLHGIYDYTCSYRVAKHYFDQLKAPLKGFYTFEQSAHSPLFEEPDKTQRILREDVLAGTNSLSDAE